MDDWYEKDDWYHPGPKTLKRIREIRKIDNEICRNMQKKAKKHGFNSVNQQYNSSRKKVKDFQIKIIKDVFSKNKNVKHIILFGRFLKQYCEIDGAGLLTSDIDLIIIVDEVNLKTLNKDIKTVHDTFEKNRGIEFDGMKEYPDYNTLDVFLFYDNLKYIGRPRVKKIKDDDEFDFFRIGNDYKVIF